MTSPLSMREAARRPSPKKPILLALAVLLAGAGLWWGWRWATRPVVPEFSLEGADPEVTAAVRRAQQAVRKQPRAADAWGQLGMALLANKLEEESILPLARAAALDPADPRWPYLRGVALLGRNPEDALPCLRRAVAACPDRSRRSAAHLRLAETLAANGHTEEAEVHFRAVPAGPLTPCAEYGLGVLAVARGDLTAGKRHLLLCADHAFTRQRAAVQLAALARRMGEKEAAADGRPAESFASDPPWPDPFVQECLDHLAGKERRMQHATSLEQQGQVDRALDVLRGVARDYPDAPSFLTLGILLGRSGHHQESEAYLRKALELEPRLLRAHYYLSLALFAQGEALQQQPGRQAASAAHFEEAARWARAATELAPQYGEAHFQLGLTLWCLHRRAEAIAAFRQAGATRPELADAHLWLGRVLAEDGKQEEALQHLRRAARYAAPDDPRPRQALEKLLQKPKP